MKRIFQIFCIVIMVFTLASCFYNQKTITVRGVPGTEIYTPNKAKIGVIKNDGTAEIKIGLDYHYPFLMSKQNESQRYVPFALDYKKKYYRCRAAFALFTLGLAGIGGIPDNAEYNYKYLSSHMTNEGISFTPIVDSGIKKTGHLNGNDGNTSDGSTTTDNDGTTIVRRSSSVVRRKSIDFAQAVTGTYIGSGSLLLKGNTIEPYSSIKVVIDSKAENKVNVRVIESGESFFDSDLEYSVMRTDNGYELVLTGISNAVILIGHDGKLSFNHPKVNIDGELYTLSISAGK